MKFERTARGCRIQGSAYELDVRLEKPLARLRFKGSGRVFHFFPGGACNADGRRDETETFGPVRLSRRDGRVLLSLPQVSTRWSSKRTVFECSPGGLEIYHEIEGEGALDRVQYLRGYTAGAEYGFAGDFDEIYNPAPNFQERFFYHPAERFHVSFGNNLSENVGGQALASPCHCLGLHDRRDRDFVSVGLAAMPGEYRWDAMEWNPPVALSPTGFAPDDRLAGGFAAVYDGKLQVHGRWTSPRLVWSVARGRDDVLPAFLRTCYRRGYLPRPRKPRARPDWWREPIYCTWHDQVALARAGNDRDGSGGQVSTKDLCSQELTDRWLGLLEKNDCKPGIVILDAAWQKHVNTAEAKPELWPDFRGWVDACHARGIRVFVWTNAWSAEGLPAAECITRDGEPVAGDITNPAYERRFRAMVGTWFSSEPGGLNADGVKIDGLLGLPTGRGLRNHGDLWGLELQKRYMDVLYEEAKRHKREACISTYLANPLLAGASDMVRIADMYTCRLTAHETMLRRAEVFRQTMPHAVVDTDGQFSHYMLDDYASELAEQARIGTPTLYAAERVYRNRFFQPLSITRMTRADYRRFAEVFRAHRARLAKEAGGKGGPRASSAI